MSRSIIQINGGCMEDLAVLLYTPPRDRDAIGVTLQPGEAAAPSTVPRPSRGLPSMPPAPVATRGHGHPRILRVSSTGWQGQVAKTAVWPFDGKIKAYIEAAGIRYTDMLSQ